MDQLANVVLAIDKPHPQQHRGPWTVDQVHVDYRFMENIVNASE